MSLDELLSGVEAWMRGAEAPHAVIGAYAVAAWGEVRGTRDLDLLVEPDGIGRLARLLADARQAHELRIGDPDDPIGLVLRFELTAGGSSHIVAVLADIRGAPAGIISRARQVSLAGLTVPVASPEDMIVLKLRAGSPRDLADAASIVRVQGARLSRALLEALSPPELAEAVARLLG